MRHAKWVVPLALVGVVVAVAMAGDLDGVPDWLEPLAVADGVQREQGIQNLAQQPDRLTDCLSQIESSAIAPTLRAAVAEAVARMRLAPADVEDAVSLLQDNRASVRAAGVRILSAHATSSRQPLARMAANKEEAVALRTMATAGLGGAGSAALSDLRTLLRSDETPTAVRLAAVRALPAVSTDGAGDAVTLAGNPKADRTEREAALQALAAQGETHAATLATLLGAPEAWLRARALAALASSGLPSAISASATALTDVSPRVRVVALRNLAAAQALSTHRTAIAGLLTDPDVRAQVLAIKFVGVTHADIASRVTPTLKSLLASASFPVRREAAVALFTLKDKSGLATMQADALSPNRSQALQAAAVVTMIQNANW